MDEAGVSLLKNTVEQSFTEKLRSLLIFGSNSRRYKDIFDMYYLKDKADEKKIRDAIQLLIFDDIDMRENDYESIVKRVEKTFNDKQYLRRVSESRQRWMDEDIDVISCGILEWLESLERLSFEQIL